ncbi:unnamed protein product, partial [Mesorhabditis spiculigera]
MHSVITSSQSSIDNNTAPITVQTGLTSNDRIVPRGRCIQLEPRPDDDEPLPIAYREETQHAFPSYALGSKWHGTLR